MKVIAFNGSPKENGNTATAINAVAEQLRTLGVEVEILQVGNKAIRGCLACGVCANNKDEKCVIKDDVVNEYFQKAKEADGIILSSPVYFSGIAGTMKSFLDRLFYVASANGGVFRHKVGANVVAVRRSGGVATFDGLNHYFLFAEMPIASSNYWNVVHGKTPGESSQDLEGMQTMSVLGEKMAWLMKLIENGAGTVEEPARQTKIAMNFIR